MLLAFGTVLTVVAGAALEWYPSRIGGPAYWLDDHLYQPVLALLTRSPNWLAIAGFLFIVALAIAFGGYLLGAHWALRSQEGELRQLWLIVGVQAALCVWLAVQPYLSSQDIFSYAFYSHIFAWYHDNPYVAVPRDYPFDPLFSAIFWKDQPSNYGPVWTYLSALAPLVAGSQVGLTLLILKAIAIVPSIVGTPMLWSTLGRLRPERRVLGTLLYAWNPLLLIETAEAGHNDVVMASLLVASLWLWCRQWRTASIATLVLAALVKYTAIILIPLYLLAWWKASGESPRRILLRSTVVGLGLSLVAFAPIYAGPSTFGVLSFGSNPLAYTNSPLELLFREARLALGESPDLADLPLHYDGHWIGSESSAIIWSFPDEKRGTGIALPAGTPLLVVEPEAASWVHVYEPKLGRFGFVRASLVRSIPVPASSVVPGTTAAVLAGVSQDPDAQKANDLVRLVSLLVFVPWYGLSLRRLARQAVDPTALPRAAVSVLVVYLLAVQSWFWPWYLIWVLPFAVIVPESAAAVVLLAMTATTGLLNAQPSISPPPFLDWLYGSRVLLIYGLPLVVAARWDKGLWSILHRIRLRTGRRLLRAVRPHRAAVGRGSAIVLLLLVPALEVASVRQAERPPAVIEWQRDFDEAVRLYSAGDYQAAVDELTPVLVALPGERSVLQLRVAANLELGRYDQTIPDLTTLLGTDPNNVDLRLERGVMYARVERSDRALADFGLVMKLAPNDPSAYEWAGLVNFERGDLVAAGLDLRKALALAPWDGQFARELANVRATENRSTEALALYDGAIRLNPSDAQAYAYRAALLRHLGSADATIPDLQEVLVLSGDVQQQQWAVRLLDTMTTPDNRLTGRTG